MGQHIMPGIAKASRSQTELADSTNELRQLQVVYENVHKRSVASSRDIEVKEDNA